MKRICPNPMSWNSAFKQLTKFAETHPCTPPLPPKPLILAGWAYSNDVEKMWRWEETVAWADNNGCLKVIMDIPDHDFYFVSKPTTYAIGPADGPMYRPWDFDSKARLSSEEIARHFETLKSKWVEIVDPELVHITRPIAFTGEKARRLLVFADASTCPPWGAHLSSIESKRRTFTRFRTSVNDAIAPHEVDHVDFTTDAEPIIPPAFRIKSCKAGKFKR